MSMTSPTTVRAGEVLTGDNITDEQIVRLRDEFETQRNLLEGQFHRAFQASLQMTRDAFASGARAKLEHQLAVLAANRDEAAASYLMTLRALGTHISWISCRNTSATERRCARQDCAEIITSRTAEGGK